MRDEQTLRGADNNFASEKAVAVSALHTYVRHMKG
jgi:hypothetical protein